MDKNSVHCTTPTPTSSSPRCGSVLAWSASMSECGSAPDGRDSFPPFAILGFVAETHRSSYGALPRTSPPQLRPSRNESPSAREGLVSTIYKIGFIAATHRTSYDALLRNESPAAKRVPLRTGGTRFHHLQDWVRSCNPPQQLRCASKRVPRVPRRETSPPPGGRDSFPPFTKIGFVAATHRTSYVALPKTSPPPRNESPIPAIASKSCLPKQLAQYTIGAKTAGARGRCI